MVYICLLLSYGLSGGKLIGMRRGQVGEIKLIAGIFSRIFSRFVFLFTGNEKEEESRLHTVQRLRFNVVVARELGRKLENRNDRSGQSRRYQLR